MDGIYTADPKLDPTAVKLDLLTYQDALARGLRVMDAAACPVPGQRAAYAGVWYGRTR